MDGTRYLPTVAWSFKVRNVILLSSATIETPATFRCTAIPFDSSDPGANEEAKEIGFYITDNVGNIYTVIGLGLHIVDLSDDFRCGVGPQTGKWAVLSKSVGRGTAPFLTPIHYRRLDKSAIDNVRRIELDILWKNDPNGRRLPFVAITMPSIPDYRADITDEDGKIFNPMEDYGQNPQFDIFQILEDGTYSQIFLGMNITRNGIDGLIDSVLFSGTGELMTGYILIKN